MSPSQMPQQRNNPNMHAKVDERMERLVPFFANDGTVNDNVEIPSSQPSAAITPRKPPNKSRPRTEERRRPSNSNSQGRSKSHGRQSTERQRQPVPTAGQVRGSPSHNPNRTPQKCPSTPPPSSSQLYAGPSFLNKAPCAEDIPLPTFLLSQH
eukprot:Rmarinus@m.19761